MKDFKTFDKQNSELKLTWENKETRRHVIKEIPFIVLTFLLFIFLLSNLQPLGIARFGRLLFMLLAALILIYRLRQFRKIKIPNSKTGRSKTIFEINSSKRAIRLKKHLGASVYDTFKQDLILRGIEKEKAELKSSLDLGLMFFGLFTTILLFIIDRLNLPPLLQICICVVSFYGLIMLFMLWKDLAIDLKLERANLRENIIYDMKYRKGSR